MTFPSCRDPKLTCDGLGFRRNGPGKDNPTFALGQCGRFSDLLTEILQKDAEGGVGKVGN